MAKRQVASAALRNTAAALRRERPEGQTRAVAAGDVPPDLSPRGLENNRVSRAATRTPGVLASTLR